MNSVNANPDGSPLKLLMIGTGKRIKKNMPVWVQKNLLELSRLPDVQRPTVLIVSSEPSIPWELAYLRLGEREGNKDFLGAFFVVGRWVFGQKDIDTGKQIPEYPPPMSVHVQSMAVISGDYSKTKHWNALKGAEEEAAGLVKTYGATSVTADRQLATWLDEHPNVDLIHFAVHGKWDLTGSQSGIVLVDGGVLKPDVVMGITFQKKPFVFLNACQLGQGEETLGDYGGIAEAFLEAGAAGVVAALWNVDDRKAKELAEEFYKTVKTTETEPGELFRRERSGFWEDTKSKLFLAYQFFGHPRLRMKLNLP